MAIIPRRINRESRGLLDLFRAKVGGQAPDEFLGQTRCNVDQLPFLASNLTGATFSTSTSSTNTTTSVTVPDDENWLIYALSARNQLVSRTADFSQLVTLRLTVPLNTGSGQITMYLGSDHQNWNGAQVTQWTEQVVTWTPPGQMILPPGSIVTAGTRGTNGNTVQVYALYAPLRV